LHAANAERAARWPQSLLTVSTHDTKRSADVPRASTSSPRCRPAGSRASPAHRLNQAHRRRVCGRFAPDAATSTSSTSRSSASGRSRRRPWKRYAARLPLHAEGGARGEGPTSWLDPDAEFEAAVDAFVRGIFASSTFLADVAQMVAEIARPGLWTALARTLVHLTAPGVPDIYQGDELWTFTLTDPDNRDPVDFEERRAALAALDGRRTDLDLVRELVASPEDGRVKLHVVRTALAIRRAHPAALAGAYAPLDVHGAGARHAFAFLRTGGGRVVVTIVPRFVSSLGEPPWGAPTWADGSVALPATHAPVRFTNVLTGEPVPATDGRIAIADAFATFRGVARRLVDVFLGRAARRAHALGRGRRRFCVRRPAPGGGPAPARSVRARTRRRRRRRPSRRVRRAAREREQGKRPDPDEGVRRATGAAAGATPPFDRAAPPWSPGTPSAVWCTSRRSSTRRTPRRRRTARITGPTSVEHRAAER
jgi:maltooligosyltrehalose synthase